MKSKFALALDLLEQEVEVLSKEQQTQFIGGDNYDSNGYDSNGTDSNGSANCSNGYCYFNNLAYIAGHVTGGAAAGLSSDCSTYISTWEDQYGLDDYEIGNDGYVAGIKNNADAASFMNTYFTTNHLTGTGTVLTGQYDGALNNGHMISAVLTADAASKIGGLPQTHDITITGKDPYGNYTYVDTTTGVSHTTTDLNDFIPTLSYEITGVASH